MSELLLQAKNIRRSFDKPVLGRIDLDLRENEFVVILGPSGCGKTTLLNVLAGFDRRARSEKLELRGQPIQRASEKIGVIFQEGSLFPWLTLEQNISFGSRMRTMEEADRRRALDRYLRQFGLTGLEGHYPDQLSGGQQQRAAVARALVNNPVLLLADEPFRALDSHTRLSLQIFLRREIESRRQTLCLITHDIDEALLLGDRIVLLSQRPATVEDEFKVTLSPPRDAATVLGEEFRRAKRDFVQFCERHGLPLFPPVEADEPGEPARVSRVSSSREAR